jgi:hypothetical protein
VLQLLRDLLSFPFEVLLEGSSPGKRETAAWTRSMPDTTVCRLSVGRELLTFLVGFVAAWKVTHEAPRGLCVNDSCHERKAARSATYEVTYEPLIHQGIRGTCCVAVMFTAESALNSWLVSMACVAARRCH